MAGACGVADRPPGDARARPLCAGARGGKAREEGARRGGLLTLASQAWMMIS